MAFLKLFDLSSTGLEITIVLCFFENFLEFLKKKKNTVILKILKISEIVQVSLKPFSLKKSVIRFYTQVFKDLKPITKQSTEISNSNFVLAC